MWLGDDIGDPICIVRIVLSDLGKPALTSEMGSDFIYEECLYTKSYSINYIKWYHLLASCGME